MREIGGYFELEIPIINKDYTHSNGILLNSGRNALKYILISLGDNLKKVYLPYYTCEVVLEPIINLGIDYEFYPINERLEIENPPILREGDYIIVNNYFGIKDNYIKLVSESYKEKLIVDQAQAWFAPVIENIKSFYSPRKFFGIPDGGVAFGVNDNHLRQSFVRDLSWTRFTHLLKRHELPASEGYIDFRKTAKKFSEEPIKYMSPLTDRILSSIDMQKIKERRQTNFKILDDALGKDNQLEIPATNLFECAMVYPFHTNDDSLRKKLIDNKIYVATYWPNILSDCDKDSIEYSLASNLIPLPIDQRYGKDDMVRIINIIKN